MATGGVSRVAVGTARDERRDEAIGRGVRVEPVLDDLGRVASVSPARPGDRSRARQPLVDDRLDLRLGSGPPGGGARIVPSRRPVPIERGEQLRRRRPRSRRS